MQLTLSFLVLLPSLISAAPQSAGKNKAAVAIIQQAAPWKDLPSCAQVSIVNTLKAGIPGCAATDLVCYCNNQNAFTAAIGTSAENNCVPSAPAGSQQTGAIEWSGKFCRLVKGVFG